MRLAATSGVEDRTVEEDTTVVAIRVDDLRRHRSFVRPCRVDTFGHEDLLAGHPTFDHVTGYGAPKQPGAHDERQSPVHR